jgi:uncharacterized protein (DUF58 family)
MQDILKFTHLKRRWQGLNDWISLKHEQWLRKRIPSNNVIQLNINNTFILPSSFGWACIGIVLCLFVLGTNFQNNIILLLCYFLLAMVLLAVFHSYFFFIQHQITFLDIPADFANRPLYLPLVINSELSYKGGSLLINAQSLVPVEYPQSKTSEAIKVPLPKFKRGYYACPRITLSATYGFGLFKCWTHLNPDLQFFVYPAMRKSSISLFRASEDAQLAHSSDSQYVITDDLQGIREYQSTDPMHHVSWKHVAKGQGMLSKDFSENKGVSGWLRMADLEHLGVEEALSCLCYQIQQLDKDQVQYGLDLGSTKILPQEGQKHLYECLTQLALFGKRRT